MQMESRMDSGQRDDSSGGDKYSIALASLAFSVSSCLMLVANKAAVVQFHHVFILLLIQNSVSVVILLATRAVQQRQHQQQAGAASTTTTTTPPEASFQENAVRWFPCAVLFCANIGTSLMALQVVSVATFTVLRNLNPFASSLFSYLLMGKRTTEYEFLGMGVCLIGSIVYGWSDLGFSWTGYATCFLHITSMSLYSVVVKLRSISMDVSTMALCNNVESLPLLLVAGAFADELDSTARASAWQSLKEFQTIAWVLVSAVGGFAISVSAIKVQKLISPPAFMVLNNVNKVPAVVVAAILFKDKINLVMASGLVVSLMGGMLFSMAASGTRPSLLICQDDDSNVQWLRFRVKKRHKLAAALAIVTVISTVVTLGQLDGSTSGVGELAEIQLPASPAPSLPQREQGDATIAISEPNSESAQGLEQLPPTGVAAEEATTTTTPIVSITTTPAPGSLEAAAAEAELAGGPTSITAQLQGAEQLSPEATTTTPIPIPITVATAAPASLEVAAEPTIIAAPAQDPEPLPPTGAPPPVIPTTPTMMTVRAESDRSFMLASGFVFDLNAFVNSSIPETLVGSNVAMKAYAKFHDDMCAGRIPPRFFSMETTHWVGLGNRLEQIELGMLLSLTYGRAFLIGWKLPMPLTRYFNLSRSAFNWNFDLATVETRLGRPLIEERIAPATLLELLADTGMEARWASTAEVIHIDHPAMIPSLPTLQRIYHHPHLRDVIPRALGEYINVVMNAMFVATDAILVRVKEFLSSLQPYERLITMQLRTRHEELRWESGDMVATFADCGKYFAGDRQTKFVLITDQEGAPRQEMFENMQRHLDPDRVFLVPSNPSVQMLGTDQDHEDQQQIKELRLDDVLFDFWLIGEGDVALICIHSSFGGTASRRIDPLQHMVHVVGPHMHCSAGTARAWWPPLTESWRQFGAMTVQDFYDPAFRRSSDLCDKA